jgi:hypothetical protein
MTTIIFYLAVMLPILAAAFFMLSQSYGAKAAYIALSWIPATSFGLLMKFQRSLGRSPEVLFPAVLVLSLLFSSFGIALTIRMRKRGQRWGSLALAACAAGIPFLLFAIMIALISQDAEYHQL